jgi:hypothetical protein
LKFKPTTHTQIEQVLKEVLYPKIEAGKTYIFNSPHGRVERTVSEVRGSMIHYSKPNGAGICPLKTFQKLYKQYGMEVPNEARTNQSS